MTEAATQRRGEGQYVCCEVGLINNPHLVTLARDLKVSRLQALAMVILWREFVLVWGSANGIVRGYSLDDVAAYVQWPRRNAGPLGQALRKGGFLQIRRGVLAYPHWLQTVTGEYTNRKAGDRETDRLRKAAARAAARAALAALSTDIHPDGNGTSAGRPPDIREESGIKEERESGGHPPTPPSGGGSGTAERVRWFEKNYPKGLVNRVYVTHVLGALDEAEWAHVQYAVSKDVASRYSKNARRAPKPEVWLRESEWRRTKLPERPAKPAPTDPAELARKLAAEKESADKAAATKALFQRRAQLRQQAVAQGVPGPKIEEWIDQQIASEVPQ